jgi:outer membrane protein assembly factor BamD (BamD/ComL family)
LYQTSAFQLISVVKKGDSKYTKQSLEKLSLAADFLGDDTLLNYAISKVSVRDFPRAHRDMLNYRIGEFQMRNGQMKDAASSFSRVNELSPFYPKAKYFEGLAYTELDQLDLALTTFDSLIETRTKDLSTINDPSRVSAIAGRARVLYQTKKWDQAIDAYRSIPRDSPVFHDGLFELSWAMLRSGKFRSALSNFQSLHSEFYEDFYLPESLLLRAIVYLYICQYSEMDKVLKLFTKTYQPIYKSLVQYLAAEQKPLNYYADVVTPMREFIKQGDKYDRKKSRIPFKLVYKVFREGDFQSNYSYILSLEEEIKRMEALSPEWRQSSLGRYASKVIKNRLQRAQAKAGRLIRAHFIASRAELFDLFEQEGFIRYEQLQGQKEDLKTSQAKSKVQGKTKKEEKKERNFYIQNGFEYYPFQGEFWLDELGNYHYVGESNCPKI